MCYHLKTHSGGTEAVIDDNCGISKFYLIADTLASELNITFLKQVDDADTLDWDFRYKSQILTLHYNIFNGVSIFTQDSKRQKNGDSAVIEIAKFLEQKVY